MRDQTLGMITATAIAAPVVVICCGGGLALISAALAGVTRWLSGADFLLSALLATAVGAVLIALRRRPDSSPSADRQTDAREQRR